MKTQTLPGPLFLTMILVGAVIVGSTYEPAAPFVMGILLLIIVGLIVNGYEQIHYTFSNP